jgi:WD40 repeat protein
MYDELSHLVINSKQINCFHTFKEHEYGVSDFCQNKLKLNELATVSFDTTIKIYDLDALKLKNNLTAHSKGVWTCDYALTNSLFVSGGNDNKLILYDSNTYKPISETNIHDEVIYDVKFSMNGNYIASCSKGMICIWDVKKMDSPLSTIRDQHKEFIFSVNFLDYDKCIVSGFIDGYIILVDSNDIQNYKKYSIPKEDVIEPVTDIISNKANSVN